MNDLSASSPNSFRRLLVISPGGKIATALPWGDTWEALSYWLNDENILIKLFRDPPSTLNALLLFNPFTGDTRRLQPDFPQVEDLTRLLWSGAGKAIYNSSGTEVVYPTLQEKGRAYVLWDIRQKKAITYLSTRDFSLAGPHWSLTDQSFAIVAAHVGASLDQNEFYQVGADGTTSELTDFHDKYPAIDLEKWSWSPDSRHIAYWYKSGGGSSQEYQLGILDVSTGQSENYCVTLLQGFLQEPLWTADSNEMALNIANLNDKVNRIVLFDLQNRSMTDVATNMYPVGWVTTGIAK